MAMYMDDKRRLSKKGSRRSVLAGGEGARCPGLKGRASRGPVRSVPGRLASLVKEQRARFYIMCRCVTMLVCWRE